MVVTGNRRRKNILLGVNKDKVDSILIQTIAIKYKFRQISRFFGAGTCISVSFYLMCNK